LSAYYEIANLEPYDEPDEEAYETFQSVDFDEFLANMRNKLQENLNYDELNRGVFKDEPIFVSNFPLKDLTVSKRGMFGAMQDIKQGRPSQTNEPVLVFYNTSNKTFLVEDGYHRVAEAYLNKEKTIPVNIYSDMWSDYVANVSPENKFNLTEAELMSLQQLPFKEKVQNLGGKIYSVGGAVRDEFLGKESKDLDILITGVPMEELEKILSKYGRVDAVGKSFGVLKFKPKGATEDIDIAIPRTEKPTGDAGHKAFDVTSDHELPIEKDLERRDFTINAIAKDIDGNVVDPFGGQKDLQNKIIRIVNPEAFSDDPLRMLRAVQFASRFGFTIEPETMKMIQDNASRIKEIPAERILTEFDKIVTKGNPKIGSDLLHKTGLFKQIFGDADISIIEKIVSFFKKLLERFKGKNPFDGVKTMGEFIWMLTHNFVQNSAEFYKNNLKGDIDTYKEIKALQMAFESAEATNLIEARAIASNMYNLAPQSLQSEILPNVIKTAVKELLQGKYPKNVGELAINGNDLMQLGLQGKEIGDTLKSLLLKVYANNIRNNREELLNLATKSKGVNEAWLITPPPMWDINGENVGLDFFVKKYDEWNNQNGEPAYRDPSRESVLEFLQNNYEDLSNDEKLKKELYWILIDREVLNEN
jgi:tRNA nucleotidyltransferase/poly(A) polymerase